MESYTSVRPEHLNHYGSLFGGQLLKWVDEFAWLAAAREFPGVSLVTRAMAEVQFARRVGSGAILRFEAVRERLGTTSVRYRVRVFAQDLEDGREAEVFQTTVTLVAIGPDGHKTPIGVPLAPSRV